QARIVLARRVADLPLHPRDPLALRPARDRVVTRPAGLRRRVLEEPSPRDPLQDDLEGLLEIGTPRDPVVRGEPEAPSLATPGEVIVLGLLDPGLHPPRATEPLRGQPVDRELEGRAARQPGAGHTRGASALVVDHPDPRAVDRDVETVEAAVEGEPRSTGE